MWFGEVFGLRRFARLHGARSRIIQVFEDLNQIDWTLLQSRNFKTDDADPGKSVRYQAEALVHRHVPLTALRGIGCFNEGVRQRLQSMVESRGLSLSIKTTPSWYF